MLLTYHLHGHSGSKKYEKWQCQGTVVIGECASCMCSPRTLLGVGYCG